jgi:hypothetical protein
MKSLVKSVATLAVIIISSVGAFAATNATDTTSTNGVAVVGGVALLIAAIVLPAFKSSKA